ncbi:MAG: acetate/propionate family kinase [Pseudomonadota bacterium]
MSDILVVNSGSSSIKIALFAADGAKRLSGVASAIGLPEATLKLGGASEARDLPDHAAAIAAVLEGLAREGVAIEALEGAAHRVVHGGASLTQPMAATPEVLAEIDRCVPLAPLHNPHNLAAIRALHHVAPALPQFVSFDTAFHASNPEVATRYALPAEAEALGIRRYGFHGISYASLVRLLPEISGMPLPRRLLACHLGNGASLCAIREGRSVATTMGYSPLEGLTMGTRSGGIDGNAVLRLVEAMGPARAARVLNNEGGLLGLSGTSADMRALEEAGTPEARFAIEHFCYWAVRHAGSMIAAMGGLDAIAFTGGIGENASTVRAAIMAGLGWAGVSVDDAANGAGGPRLHAEGSSVTAWVVPAEEEAMIAREARALLSGAVA